MKEYDSALEFGQVSIGGVTVLGPVRRISMYLAPLMAPRTTSSMAESTYRRFQLTDSPLQEYLNDIRFGGFRPYNPAEPQPALTARSDPASVAPVSGR
jgi:hypothetical protein